MVGNQLLLTYWYQSFGLFQEASMAIAPISFAQIATAVTPKGAVLYGLTASGTVYEYNFSREVWIPLPMRALPQSELEESVVGLRGPGSSRAEGCPAALQHDFRQ
jgi:hypothetical protein